MKNMILPILLLLVSPQGHAVAGSVTAEDSPLSAITSGMGLSGGSMIGKFSNWLNVQTDYGAMGDGVTDDTPAIQRALSQLGKDYGGQRVLYFPAGTYRITEMLRIIDRSGIALVGEDPETTVLKWDGADGGVLLSTNGLTHSRIQRLTFDGNRKTQTVIHLKKLSGVITTVPPCSDGRDNDGDGATDCDDSGCEADIACTETTETAENTDEDGNVQEAIDIGTYETSNELSDLIIKDSAYGIKAGFHPSTASAELLILRCQFLRNTAAGYQSNGYNTVDIWIRDSYFKNNYVGVTNAGPLILNPDGTYRADSRVGGFGHFNVSSSHFMDSEVADMLVHPSNNFGIRHNTSIGSNAFFVALNNGQNGSQVTLQNNLIWKSVSAAPIQLETLGPIFLLDNTVRSQDDQTEPVVTSSLALDLTSLGNAFTVANAFSLTNAEARHIEIDTETVDPTTLSLDDGFALPATPTWYTGPVIEVATNATAGDIQQAIDRAVSLPVRTTVVHIPAGAYDIDQTLIIPAEKQVRLVGDGFMGEGPLGTYLKWTGTDDGPVLKLKGPSRAGIQDLMVGGNGIANGIVVEDADQSEGRIYGHFIKASENIRAGISVHKLDSTLVELHEALPYWQCVNNETGPGGCVTGGAAIKVVGGPDAAAGGHVTGRVNIFMGGSGGNDAFTADVTQGGRLLLQDFYHENDNYFHPYMHLTDQGRITIDIAKMQRLKGGEPIVQMDDFQGHVTLIGVNVTKPILVTGNIPTDVLALGISETYSATETLDHFFKNTSTAAQVSRLNSRQSRTDPTGSWPAANQGSSNPNFIRKMLAHVRSEIPTRDRTAVPEGATHVSLMRVWARRCLNGFHFQSGSH
jgi:hypothetical protein